MSPGDASDAALRTASSMSVARTVGRSRNAEATSAPASPMPTAAETFPAVPSTERSTPLFRPPAMSTTESKPSSAARVAWGVVAFESL